MNCQVELALAPIPVPAAHFSHLHINFVGHLPVSSGFTHLLMVVDRISRWPKVLPLSSTSATNCASALIGG
jgi:hypothetical protein